MDITFAKLKELGFKPWGGNITDETAWLIESSEDGESSYDRELDCWKPSYRITINLIDSDRNIGSKEWKCTAWFSDNSVKSNKVFRRVVVDNIMSVEDIQSVINILKIDLKLK